MEKKDAEWFVQLHEKWCHSRNSREEPVTYAELEQQALAKIQETLEDPMSQAVEQAPSLMDLAGFVHMLREWQGKKRP